MTNVDQALDVAVIGAGFSGLAAARRLRDRGLKTAVFEARERVGGRVYTRTLEDGTYVELGGQWVGPTQDRLLALIQELGLRTFRTFDQGRHQLFLDGGRATYRGTVPKVGLVDAVGLGWAQLALGWMARKIPLEAPWSHRDARRLDEKSLADFLDAHCLSRRARKIVDAALEAVFAAPADKISLLHALFYIRSGGGLSRLVDTKGGAQDSRVVGGMQLVAEKMAEGLDVRFNEPVAKIEQDASSAWVHAGGWRAQAKYVVVTVPLPLISRIAFEPELPKKKQSLRRGVAMAAVIKCTAVYSEPFWRGQRLSGHSISDQGPIQITYDNSPPGEKRGILLGFAEADHAREIGGRPLEERREIALRCFAERFGERAREPLFYADHVWERDDWAGGGYGAYWKPQTWTEHGHALRTPFGRIHWAGTETATKWSGYIEGAIGSGERAADEILAAEGRP